MAKRKWDCSSVKLTQTDVRIQELPSYSCTLEGYLMKTYNVANTYCGNNDTTPKNTHMEITCSQDGQQQQQRHHDTSNSTCSPAGLPRISTRTLMLQTLVLLQSLLLVTSQAFPVGCEWRFVNLHIVVKIKNRCGSNMTIGVIILQLHY